MRAIYAVRLGKNYKFYYRRHDEVPEPYSRLLGRVDDVDARLIIDWCYAKQREGWNINRIERELR